MTGCRVEVPARSSAQDLSGTADEPAFFEPTTGTPERAAVSIRRTSTLTMEVTPTGELHLDGASRDLLTDRAGCPNVTSSSSLAALTESSGERRLHSITTNPPIEELELLVGESARSGFRRRSRDLLATAGLIGTGLRGLLDDMPIATIISGYGALHDGTESSSPAEPVHVTPDLCAGWREGGEVVLTVRRTGTPPRAGAPTARPLAGPDNDGWHATTSLEHGQGRRHRRLDLTLRDQLLFNLLLRDVYRSVAGEEVVIHEYELNGAVDVDTLTVLELEVVAHVLPAFDCGTAGASAQRIVGRSVAELDGFVGATMRGASTCTHLNDCIRTLADVPALLDTLRSRSLSA